MPAIPTRSRPPDMAVPEPHAPPKPTLTHRLELAALRAVAFVLERFGVDRASATMGFLWRHLAPFNPRHRRADGHLAASMPELGKAERRAILGDMWENLGRTAAETFLLPRMIRDDFRFVLDDRKLDPHREALAKGSVFASLHSGNWEFCGWGIHMTGLPVAAVYRPLKNPLADAFLRARREAIFTKGIYPRQSATALKLRTLARQGVAIGMLADLKDRTGLVAPFFGRPARLATFPVVLARRLRLPLIVGRVVRTDGARFRIEAERIAVPRPTTWRRTSASRPSPCMRPSSAGSGRRRASGCGRTRSGPTRRCRPKPTRTTTPREADPAAAATLGGLCDAPGIG